MSNYNSSQHVQNSANFDKNPTNRTIEEGDLVKVHHQTSDRFTHLENHPIEVKQGDNFIELQTLSSSNSNIYESTEGRDLNTTNCAFTHLASSFIKQINSKDRRGKRCLAYFIFVVLLVVVIASTSLYFMLKSNSPDPDKQNITAKGVIAGMSVFLSLKNKSQDPDNQNTLAQGIYQ
ncbi:unnamed protein product [Mytilus edulis]|uniref:Uncharacterized protein n=1 Tax=Mytilus edulis TaxID=6550 RepID=A0A8S3RLW6_MYTED|nr:unnamed protein product [Mytilus edulis]